MRKTIYSIVLLFLSLYQQQAGAQPPQTALAAMTIEKDRLIENLRNNSVDTIIAYSLAYRVDSAITHIYSSIGSVARLPLLEKDKAIRSLVFLMKELNWGLEQKKIYLYEIPVLIKAYRNILMALLYHKPIQRLTESLEPHQSQLLTSTFSQYKEFALLDEITVYKRMASSPDFIFQFLENKPNFRFADSLIIDAATHDPQRMVFYLNSNKPGIQERIRQVNNIYLSQLVSLSGDKQASELVPFVVQVAEQKMTREEILRQRSSSIGYFQLLVNTLLETNQSKGSNSVFLQTIRGGIKQKALAFYVNTINDLHSSADALRFSSVKELRAEDLYYIITSCGDELYTSSYLGLYKRLMEHFNDQQADSLFERVNYDNFHLFIRLAANYNVLADFLHRMQPDKMELLLSKFITGIGNETNPGLDRAMDIADCFSAVASDEQIIAVIDRELHRNLEQSKTAQQYLGIRLYSILLEIMDQVTMKGDGVWSKLGNYEELKRDALIDTKGNIVEMVLFYGDEDGVASFSNFQKYYSASKWSITKKDKWISLRSLQDTSFIIYANRPLDSEAGLDLLAQDELFTYLKEQALEPSILVHRGHSYHLDKTLKRLGPFVKLAILGSCGSYNKAISIASINADVQVIGSKKTGSKSINDPIIDMINDNLVSKKDIIWSEGWKKLSDRFSADAATLIQFNEYFPPSKNLSLFVLKMFMYYRGYRVHGELVKR